MASTLAQERRIERYAAKFMAETWSAEPREPLAPTDANLAEIFRNCARPAKAAEYGSIRNVLLDQYGVGRT